MLSLKILLLEDDMIEVMKLNRTISSLKLNHKIIEASNGTTLFRSEFGHQHSREDGLRRRHWPARHVQLTICWIVPLGIQHRGFPDNTDHRIIHTRTK